MSLWAEIPLLFVVILGMLIGFFGLFLVFFPGLTVIWASILLWGISTSFNYDAQFRSQIPVGFGFEIKGRFLAHRA